MSITYLQHSDGLLVLQGSHFTSPLSWLSQHWFCGNSCTWAHDVRTYSRLTYIHTKICKYMDLMYINIQQLSVAKKVFISYISYKTERKD